MSTWHSVTIADEFVSELVDAYVQRGLTEFGEGDPAKRLLLAIGLTIEAEKALTAYTAEQRHIAWAEGYSWCFADDEPFEGVRSLDDNPYRAPKGSTDAKPCKTCGHQPAAHHKLHCESPGCDYCTGWTCREHGLALCGCTYAGGPTPTPPRGRTDDRT